MDTTRPALDRYQKWIRRFVCNPTHEIILEYILAMLRSRISTVVDVLITKRVAYDWALAPCESSSTDESPSQVRYYLARGIISSGSRYAKGSSRQGTIMIFLLIGSACSGTHICCWHSHRLANNHDVGIGCQNIHHSGPKSPP